MSSFEQALAAARETWARYPLVNDPTRFSAAADAFFVALGEPAAAGQEVPAVSDEMVERAAKALYYEHHFEPPQPGDDRWEHYGGRAAYRMIARDVLRSALSEPTAEQSAERGGEQR